MKEEKNAGLFWSRYSLFMSLLIVVESADGFNGSLFEDWDTTRSVEARNES
jgi:hypothetical protein